MVNIPLPIPDYLLMARSIEIHVVIHFFINIFLKRSLDGDVFFFLFHVFPPVPMPFPSPALASSRQEVMRVRALDQQSAASRKKKGRRSYCWRGRRHGEIVEPIWANYVSQYIDTRYPIVKYYMIWYCVLDIETCWIYLQESSSQCWIYGDKIEHDIFGRTKTCV